MHPRILGIILLASTCAVLAQNPGSATNAKGVAANSSKECGISAIQICALHVAQDEWGIVTAPLRIRPGDEFKVAGFGLGTTLAMATDVNAMQELGVDPGREHNASTYSNAAGIYGPAADVTIGYFAASAKHNRRLQETSILAEEAMVDSFILNTALGYGIDRQTPTQGNGKGNFWPYGPKTWPDGQSMPSDHSVLAWSFARVVAAEYPTKTVELSVYTLAASVSAARVVARKHFPSDVFVGGALGYYIGGYVIRHRATQLPVHDFSLSPIRTPNGNGIELSYNFSH